MDINQAYQQADKLKTLAEHESIILNYLRNRWLDRHHAISVYRDFSAKNPDYLLRVQIEASVKGNGADVTALTDDQIVYNLNQQILYLSGRSLLEELCNGK